MTKFGIHNLPSFTLFLAKFQLDQLTRLGLLAVKVTTPQNLTEFDLLTLTSYREREMRLWQPGVSDTLTAATSSNTVVSFEQKCHQQLFSEFWPVDYTGCIA